MDISFGNPYRKKNGTWGFTIIGASYLGDYLKVFESHDYQRREDCQKALRLLEAAVRETERASPFIKHEIKSTEMELEIQRLFSLLEQSSDEQQKLLRFLAKSPHTLMGEVIVFLQKRENWVALFDRQRTKRQQLALKKFWDTKYPVLEKASSSYWGNKVSHVEARYNRLPSLTVAQGRVYNHLLDQFYEWSKLRGKKEVGSADKDEFLAERELLGGGYRLYRDLWRDVNKRLKRVK